MKKTNTVITISREFGSGGRAVGEKLAKDLGIPFYDREIIEKAAIESGEDEATFLDEETKTSKGFYFLKALGYPLGSPTSIIPGSSPNDQAFMIQSNVMRELASKGSCVIIGRCGDFILQDFEDVISIYIHAPLEERLKRAENEYGIKDEDLEEITKRIDKQRANYYNYYTDRKWGYADNYNLSFDTSKFGVKETAKMIEVIIKTRDQK